MILQDKTVLSARKEHICTNCGYKIQKGESYRYMYGAPDYGDHPYALKLCERCDDKIVGGYDE